jgi:uncharacterized protein (DUF433 family)
MAMSVQTPQTLDLSRYIEAVFFDGRPHIRGRRIPAATIAYNYRSNGWTVTETADNFGLSEPEVFAALLYYEENRTEIDAQERHEQELFDADYRDQSWKL